jgi:hypothetical protein
MTTSKSPSFGECRAVRNSFSSVNFAGRWKDLPVPFRGLDARRDKGADVLAQMVEGEGYQSPFTFARW